MYRWLQDRLDDILPCPYFHVICTLPDAFNGIARAHAELVYGLLFRAANDALQRMAKRVFDARLGFIGVLHTWGQSLCLHPHLHLIVTGGGLSTDGKRWVPSAEGYLFDVRALSATFRDRFCQLLERAAKKGKLTHTSTAKVLALTSQQKTRDWVVHCKKPFSGPRKVLEYLARYMRRQRAAWSCRCSRSWIGSFSTCCHRAFERYAGTGCLRARARPRAWRTVAPCWVALMPMLMPMPMPMLATCMIRRC